MHLVVLLKTLTELDYIHFYMMHTIYYFLKCIPPYHDIIQHSKMYLDFRHIVFFSCMYMCIRFSRGAPPKKRRFSTVTRKSKAQPPHAIRVGYFIYITVSLISTKPSDFAKPGAQPSFRRRDAQTSGEVGRCQVCCWSRWRFVVGYFVAGNIPLMKIDKKSNSEIVRFW